MQTLQLHRSAKYSTSYLRLFWPVWASSPQRVQYSFSQTTQNPDLDARSYAVIPRYTRPEMGRIWSEENKFRTWLQVEVAATETLAEAGLVPQSAARAIRDKGDFDLARIQAVEAEVKHDVIAFTTAVSEKVGPEARWLHYGLTSNDVVDTAQAL